LALAYDQSLPHLKAVAVDFVVRNYEIVSETEAYAALGKEHVDLVALEACRIQRQMKETLLKISANDTLPDP